MRSGSVILESGEALMGLARPAVEVFNLKKMLSWLRRTSLDSIVILDLKIVWVSNPRPKVQLSCAA